MHESTMMVNKKQIVKSTVAHEVLHFCPIEFKLFSGVQKHLLMVIYLAWLKNCVK